MRADLFLEPLVGPFPDGFFLEPLDRFQGLDRHLVHVDEAYFVCRKVEGALGHLPVDDPAVPPLSSHPQRGAVRGDTYDSGAVERIASDP
jgi:hypothetical protein